jgi:tRNA dimethylallyltransferase
MSPEAMLEEIQSRDPVTAKRIDPKNQRRLVRALEVIRLTGLPFSALRQKGARRYDVLFLAPLIEREELYKRIDLRIDQMIERGLVDEVRQLRTLFDPQLPSMSSIGYAEIGRFLEGKCTLAEAVRAVKTRTHAYVRRQMTWFRREKRIQWVREVGEAERIVHEWLQHVSHD